MARNGVTSQQTKVLLIKLSLWATDGRGVIKMG